MTMAKVVVSDTVDAVGVVMTKKQAGAIKRLIGYTSGDSNNPLNPCHELHDLYTALSEISGKKIPYVSYIIQPNINGTIVVGNYN
jgi:hypothetical protein